MVYHFGEHHDGAWQFYYVFASHLLACSLIELDLYIIMLISSAYVKLKYKEKSSFIYYFSSQMVSKQFLSSYNWDTFRANIF